MLWGRQLMIYTYIMSHLFFRGVGRDNKSALTSALTHLYCTVHIHELLCFSSGPDSSELHCMVHIRRGCLLTTLKPHLTHSLCSCLAWVFYHAYSLLGQTIKACSFQSLSLQLSVLNIPLSLYLRLIFTPHILLTLLN